MSEARKQINAGLASYTNTYWLPGSDYETRTAAYPISGNLGFLFDLPRTNPIAGPWYYGEGTLPGDRKLVMKSQPEYYAVDRTLPTINGRPMVDIESAPYKFDREQYTFRWAGL